jgi:hypothetical protein
MKRMVLFVTALLLFAIPALAQDNVPEPTQNPDATYRLFRTQNIYTLLKLDTRTGVVWQVQWGDEQHRFTVPIHRTLLLPVGSAEHPTIAKPGRFTLNPTANIHTFLLLDQEDGRTWQIQWGGDGERSIVPIA